MRGLEVDCGSIRASRNTEEGFDSKLAIAGGLGHELWVEHAELDTVERDTDTVDLCTVEVDIVEEDNVELDIEELDTAELELAELELVELDNAELELAELELDTAELELVAGHSFSRCSWWEAVEETDKIVVIASPESDCQRQKCSHCKKFNMKTNF